MPSAAPQSPALAAEHSTAREDSPALDRGWSLPQAVTLIQKVMLRVQMALLIQPLAGPQ